MADSLLFDRTGRPIPISTLYKTPSQMGIEIPRVPRPRAKTYEAVSSWQRREMVDVSRVIAAGVPNIGTALIQAGEFSVGDSWHIKYRGTNKAWGKKRDEWFNRYYARDCNSRGQHNDWHSTLRQLVWTRKVQGDYAIVFDGKPSVDAATGKKREPTGRFNIIKFDRISSTPIGGNVSVGNGLEEVKELPRSWNYYWSYYSSVGGYNSWPGIYIINDPSSPFYGQRIIDGVIIDANMVVLGYRVTGFNEAGSPTYSDLPKQQVHFNFSAREDTDLIRGIPELAMAIIPIMGLDDIAHFITMAIKLASAMGVTRESTDGNPGRSNRANYDEDLQDSAGNTVTVKRAVEEIYPGIIELATNNKESLKQFNFDRPSMNEEAFISRIETSLLHKLWPRSLIYASETGRAGARAIGIQANTICSWDQICLERSARWIADRATEFSMRMGFVPTNDNLYDPYEYVFTCPGKFTVDEGNDAKIRLNALGRCCISHGRICEMDGYLAEEVFDERAIEIDRILTGAKTLAAKHPEFDVKEIALMFDSNGNNISFSDNAQQDEDEETAGGTGGTGGTEPPAGGDRRRAGNKSR